MPVVLCATEVCACAADLFALSQDYRRRLSWDPFVRRLDCLEEARDAAVGVRVRVRARNGLGMVIRYTTVRPPKCVAFTLTRRAAALGIGWAVHAVLRCEMERRLSAFRKAAEAPAVKLLSEPRG